MNTLRISSGTVVEFQGNASTAKVKSGRACDPDANTTSVHSDVAKN
jgi:hypothetical protein